VNEAIPTGLDLPVTRRPTTLWTTALSWLEKSRAGPAEVDRMNYDDVWGAGLSMPMQSSTFERLPRHHACRYEYVDGRALLTVRPQYAHVVLSLDACGCADGDPLETSRARPLTNDDWAVLPALLASAFWHQPPLVLLPRGRREAAARLLIERTRTGQDGTLVETACFIGTEIDTVGQYHDVSAALVTLVDPATRRAAATPEASESPAQPIPHLTWIFVNDWRKRRGVGTTLLRAIVRALRAHGYAELASTVMPGNTASLMWHWRRGFRLHGWLDS
jgi:hypothetical protein